MWRIPPRAMTDFSQTHDGFVTNPQEEEDELVTELIINEVMTKVFVEQSQLHRDR